MSGTSYRIDETYIRAGKSCKYLRRAVDKDGQAIRFMLSAKRDVIAAKRFFRKVMRADHGRLPFSINTDKCAAYPDALIVLQEDKVVPFDCKLRRVKHLNNVIETARRRYLQLLPARMYVSSMRYDVPLIRRCGRRRVFEGVCLKACVTRT
jgi:transposase-like protein